MSRIFIPGNYYNVDTEPYPPTHHRQSITKAIAEITREDPSIRIMGVCGGLQGVMHALGIKVTRVGNLVSSAESATAHAVSMPDPHGKDVHLHRMRVVPNSRLAGIVSKHVSADVNGWISLFFPDAHGGVVSNDPENMKKLESMGYRVVGFSDDGVIEAVEDMHGNILFQDHPEALAINILKGNVFHFSEGGSSTQEDVTTHTEERYKAALSAVAIIEDFLYR